MFFNILDEPRQILLKKLSAASPVPDSYLAGGTALALMFGHRESIDFDWFTPSDFDPGELTGGGSSQCCQVKKHNGRNADIELRSSRKGGYNSRNADIELRSSRKVAITAEIRI